MMANGSGSSNDQAFMKRGVDLAVRLGLLAVILISCYRIFRPFLTPVVWGIIIAVALYPVFLKLRKMLGGKNRLAGVIFIVVSLAALLVPTWFLMGSLIDGTVEIGQDFRDGKVIVGPPPQKVQTWPVVGEKVYETWEAANSNLEGLLRKLEPQLKQVGTWLIHTFTDLGGAVLQTIIALIIAGVLMMNSAGGERLSRSIGMRLAGETGVEMVKMSALTIQSVVKGVVLIALIQSFAAGIGMLLMNVPLAGLWALIILVIAIVQLPPTLVLLPVIIYVFSTSDNQVANIVFTIYALVVGAADSFLKPLFLGRGVEVPMLIILIGAIGGMLTAGVVGLFVGAVVLAVGYKLFEAWVSGSWPDQVAADNSETDG
ncbi:MAG: AI-2E family transporter [Candidatus Latescibacterota bacterium]|jgi:predicted PurR-regulated permease PerM